MDLIHALRILRRRWKWAAIGLVPALYLGLSTAYHVDPSGLHEKSLEYGAAQTQLLVDSPQSTLAEAAQDVTPLSTRATVFAQFFQTTPVKSAIAKRLGVRTHAIAVTIPNTNPNLTTAATEQNVGQRNTGLLQETGALQLLVVPQPALPLITVYAQGPDGAAAAALANAAANALHDYVDNLKGASADAAQAAQRERLGLPAVDRVTVRQLGAAQGGMVDSGTSKKIAVLAIIALAIVDCIIVIMLGGFVANLKARKRTAGDTVEEIEDADTHEERDASGLPFDHETVGKPDAAFDRRLTAARE